MDRQTIEQIPVDSIVFGDQVRKRFDEGSLAGLAQSMSVAGQQEPIHLLASGDGMYRVLTGERRVRAARQCGKTTILAIIEQADLSGADLLLRQLTENIQREDLTPIEKAKAIEALIKETEWTATQAASKLGLTNGTVSKLLSLLMLPEELQQRIDAGEVPASSAYHLSTLGDTEARNQFADKVARGELTRDELSTAIKATKRRQRHPQKPRPMRVTAKLENAEAVSVSAFGLDLNSFVTILEKLLTTAQRARSDGMTLDALLKRLAGQRAASFALRQTA